MMANRALLCFILSLFAADAFVLPYRSSHSSWIQGIVDSPHLDGISRLHDRPREATRTTSLQVSKVALTTPTSTTSSNSNVQLKSYNHDGYKLTYLYKPASPKYRNAPPILLIHPVGIGMSSWFWERLMEQDGPAMYAVDLIGCGITHGADAWDPNKRGMSVPLAWVKACETLMQQQVATKTAFSLPFMSSSPSSPKYTVVAQGGLAPVGLLLTARNLDRVNHLVLTSPPTDLTTAVTEKELARNYGFFTGRWTAPVAFGLLETRRAVEFFSNLFLFAQPCDEIWLDQAAAETSIAARPPVQVFNAGFCQARSYELELEAVANSLSTRVLVLQGQGDTPRNADRNAYYTNQLADKCQITTVPGKNVLPWESPQETMRAILDFVDLP